jgi:hypothetical protein
LLTPMKFWRRSFFSVQPEQNTLVGQSVIITVCRFNVD